MYICVYFFHFIGGCKRPKPELMDFNEKRFLDSRVRQNKKCGNRAPRPKKLLRVKGVFQRIFPSHFKKRPGAQPK